MYGEGMSKSDQLVLLVEDDLEIRESLRDFLRDEGYLVWAAQEGQEALDLLRSGGIRPSTILVDLLMPGMDGWQLIQYLKSDAMLKDIPIVIISAVTDAGLGETYGLTLMKKPLDLDRLLETIAQSA
jgi:CheY-like chemotaxis protein